MGKIKLGSIYLGEDVQTPGFACTGGELVCFTDAANTEIRLGDTVPGRELQWVQDGSMLVADRCVCTAISWDALNRLGYIFGVPVNIDGRAYRCRSLKIGATLGGPNEWVSLLARHGASNDLWHWERMYFWGQEVPATKPNRRQIHRDSYRVVRGFYSARAWDCNLTTNQGVFVGFRPVLEPIAS